MSELKELLSELKDLESRVNDIEVELEENFGSGTVIAVQPKGNGEGYTAIIIKVPGHGYSIVNMSGEVNSELSCPNCNESQLLSNEKDEDEFEDDDSDDDDEDLKDVPKTYLSLIELYEDIDCEVKGSLLNNLHI